MHYTDEDYIKCAYMLLKLLGISSPECSDGGLSMLGYECMRWRNLYLATRASLNRAAAAPQVVDVALSDLNSYVKGIENLEDFIVVIAAKDEAKNMISNFTEKSALGLEMPLVFRGSYIAVVDKRRGFVYENASSERLYYKYEVMEGAITVESAGYTSGNMSSIKLSYGETTVELSQNRRGLNIALLNSQTLELVDSFKCDTHLDSRLEVQSQYLARLVAQPKIKV